MDKVQKIKEWISKEQDGLTDVNGNFEYPEHEGAYHILCNLDAYIDSLQEELISENLEKAAEQDVCEVVNTCSAIGIPNDHMPSWVQDAMANEFIHGANWKERQMMAKAIDAHCFGFQGVAALFTFRLPASSYLVGSKVKVIVIKED